MKTALYLFAGYAVAFIALWLMGGFIILDWDVRNWDSGGRFAVAWLSMLGVVAAGAARATT